MVMLGIGVLVQIDANRKGFGEMDITMDNMLPTPDRAFTATDLRPGSDDRANGRVG